jgi:pimeloyl-ACP methyl ester carboxylesterase
MPADPQTTLRAALGEPQFYEGFGGVRLGYYSAGPKDGLPVVLCHGFPELAYSWRAQMKALAAAGRRVIALDARGYGVSDAPKGVGLYDIDHLTGDLVALLDHLEADKAVFVGHDWGGLVSWQMPLLHPGRVAGNVGVNTPFIPRGPVDPITAFRARYGDDMYIVQFQTPHASEALFEADVEKTMRFFMRLPGAREAEAAAFSGSGGQVTLALQQMLQRYDPAADDRQLLPPEELAVFIAAFKAKGFEAPINWYRNFNRNWERMEGVPQAIPQPSLMIMAELDIVLPPALAELMTPFVPDLEKHLIQGSGHWTQQEKPEAVNAILIDWLDRRFPAT